MNVSERSVHRAKKVQTQGIPELIRKVDAGDVKVSVAADVATLPEYEQRHLVALNEKAILNAAKNIRSQKASPRASHSQWVGGVENLRLADVNRRRAPDFYACNFGLFLSPAISHRLNGFGLSSRVADPVRSCVLHTGSFAGTDRFAVQPG